MHKSIYFHAVGLILLFVTAYLYAYDRYLIGACVMATALAALHKAYDMVTEGEASE